MTLGKIQLRFILRDYALFPLTFQQGSLEAWKAGSLVK
jgi:hypothetical protein